MKQLFLSIEQRTTAFALLASCAMLAIAAALGFWQILTRFVLEQPSEWTEVLIRFALIWMVFMGIAAAFRQGAMVCVDVLHRWSGPGMRRVLEWSVAAVSIVLLVLVVWIGWDYAQRGKVQSVAGLEDMSMFWAYLAMPVGGVFAILGVIGNALDPRREDLELAQ
jgi:TRAP-type C4-dicarboxylate transport system permease small subunit